MILTILAVAISLGLVFWLLLIVAFVFGLLGYYRENRFYSLGGNILVLVLIIILGLAVFSPELTK